MPHRIALLFVLVLVTNTYPAQTYASSQFFNIKGGNFPSYINQSEPAFGKPGGISVTPSGAYLLIADPVDSEIKVFDTGRLKQLSQFGKGELNKPEDLSFDQKGRLLVTDTGNNRIMIYDFQGVFRDGDPNIKHIATLSNGLSKPSSVSAGSGKRLYVINSANDSIIMFDGNKVVKTITSAGPDNTTLTELVDIHRVSKNRVLVSDSGNNRILVFDSDLNFVQELTTKAYGFDRPGRIASDENGMVLIADEGSHSVKIMNSAYKPKGEIRTDAPLFGNLNTPQGIETVGRYMWVSDMGNKRIILFKRE
jgi:DNA-binding beta-propeller fold protein YncE